jgi:hypothetical protein
MKIVLKNLNASRTRDESKIIDKSKMPTGRYGLTVTNIVFSDTTKDTALYVNYTVHGNNGISKQMSVRCEPHMRDDHVDFKRNLSSIYVIGNFLDAIKPESSKRFKGLCAAMKAAYITGQDEAVSAAASSIYEMAESLSGVNFTAYFEWNASKTDGREWFNLRSDSDNPAKAISLDNVREPVTESAEQERQPKRNLTAVKR